MTRQVPISVLMNHPDNPPGRTDDIAELADSIRAAGVLQPLLVEPFGNGRYVVVEGNRRLAAARAAGLNAVPVYVRAQHTRRDHVRDRLAANGHRRNLTPIEQAHGFGALAKAGLSQAEIARVTGFSESHVSARLALLELGEATQRLVDAGRLPAEDALAAVRSMRGNSTGAKPKPVPYFGATHPLATAAADRCRTAHQRTAGRIGGIACGPCWETTIRTDATAHVAGAA